MAIEFLKKASKTPQSGEEETVRIVEEMLQAIESAGEEKVREYTKTLDKYSGNVVVTPKEIAKSASSLSKQIKDDIKFAYNRVRTFAKKQLESITEFESEIAPGVFCGQKQIPMETAGCYVPGGDAIYVSSLLMTVLPAKVAGVNRIVVTSPPSKNGDIPPLLLVAADICGVDEFYKIGGAQAIAALAYGTESLKSVNKIVGPGNIYVTAAKLIVSSVVGIDIPAGPSELLILADKSANANFIARDLISQAEHRHDSIAGLVTDSPNLIKNVTKVLNEYLQQLTRSEIVLDSFFANAFIVLCKDRHQMINFANIFAAEHLEIMTNYPKNIVNKITSAGLILLGPYSPSAATDYCVGTNHVLPTSKFARSSSGLSSLDFVKQVNVVECSKLGLNNLRKHISVLALSEGLSNHKLAVEERFRDETK